jgi:hypothetical protein
VTTSVRRYGLREKIKSSLSLKVISAESGEAKRKTNTIVRKNILGMSLLPFLDDMVHKRRRPSFRQGTASRRWLVPLSRKEIARELLCTAVL